MLRAACALGAAAADVFGESSNGAGAEHAARVSCLLVMSSPFCRARLLYSSQSAGGRHSTVGAHPCRPCGNAAALLGGAARGRPRLHWTLTLTPGARLRGKGRASVPSQTYSAVCSACAGSGASRGCVGTSTDSTCAQGQGQGVSGAPPCRLNLVPACRGAPPAAPRGSGPAPAPVPLLPACALPARSQHADLAQALGVPCWLGLSRAGSPRAAFLHRQQPVGSGALGVLSQRPVRRRGAPCR